MHILGDSLIVGTLKVELKICERESKSRELVAQDRAIRRGVSFICFSYYMYTTVYYFAFWPVAYNKHLNLEP